VPREADIVAILISITRTIIHENIDVSDLVIKGVDKLNTSDV
jgi:hypothetical protein